MSQEESVAFEHHLPSPPPSSRSAELERSQEHGTPSPHSSQSVATPSLQKKQAASVSHYSQTLCQADAADRSDLPSSSQTHLYGGNSTPRVVLIRTHPCPGSPAEQRFHTGRDELK